MRILLLLLVLITHQINAQNTVLFKSASAELDSEVIKKLDSIVSNVDTACTLNVSGYTDANGSKSFNKNLSRERALAVNRFFLNAGISSQDIFIDYQGELSPVGDNNTEDGRRINRRVEIIINCPSNRVQELADVKKFTKNLKHQNKNSILTHKGIPR